MVDDLVETVLLKVMPHRTQQQFLRHIEQGKAKSLHLLPCQIRMLKNTQIKYENKEMSSYEFLLPCFQSMTFMEKERFVCIERCKFCDQYGVQCPSL